MEQSIALMDAAPDHPDLAGLIAKLDAYLLELYPADEIFGVDFEDPGIEQVMFVLAYCDGQPAGCGAVRSLDARSAELKRFYVEPQYRRRGIAGRLLEALERKAQALGAAHLRLETGGGQTEALLFFKRSGFYPIERYGEYADCESSLCFEKPLGTNADSGGIQPVGAITGTIGARPLRLAFMASHGGTNMQAVIDAWKGGVIRSAPVLLISNNSQSTAIERVKRENIPFRHISGLTHPDPGHQDAAILDALQSHGADLIVMVGYMKKLGPSTLEAYKGKIINIHPSLLPKFGGHGMYGRRVHEAVLAAGERMTGATVHIVDGDYDTGPALAQRQVEVIDGDTVETLAERVLRCEHRLIVETIRQIEDGIIRL